MRALSALLVVGYLVGTVLLGLGVAVAGEFACSEIECSSEAPWYDDAGAWQWDAMIVLGLASVLLGFAALATTMSARVALLPIVLLALHGGVIGVAVGLLLVAGVGNRVQVTMGCLATLGVGAALIYVRARARPV